MRRAEAGAEWITADAANQLSTQIGRTTATAVNSGDVMSNIYVLL